MKRGIRLDDLIGALRRGYAVCNRVRCDRDKVLVIIELHGQPTRFRHAKRLRGFALVQQILAVLEAFRCVDRHILAGGGLDGVGAEQVTLGIFAEILHRHLIGGFLDVLEVDLERSRITVCLLQVLHVVHLEDVVMERPAVEGLRDGLVALAHAGRVRRWVQTVNHILIYHAIRNRTVKRCICIIQSRFIHRNVLDGAFCLFVVDLVGNAGARRCSPSGERSSSLLCIVRINIFFICVERSRQIQQLSCIVKCVGFVCRTILDRD